MTQQQVRDAVERITGRRLERAQQVGGIVWVREVAGHRYALVPSDSQPGTYHKVTGTGCDCKGWEHRGSCRHYDAVMLRLRERHEAKAGATAPATTAGDSPEFTRWLAAMAADEAQEQAELLAMAEQARRDTEALYGPAA